MRLSEVRVLIDVHADNVGREMPPELSEFVEKIVAMVSELTKSSGRCDFHVRTHLNGVVVQAAEPSIQ
jgi:hypothetical protein